MHLFAMHNQRDIRDLNRDRAVDRVDDIPVRAEAHSPWERTGAAVYDDIDSSAGFFSNTGVGGDQAISRWGVFVGVWSARRAREMYVPVALVRVVRCSGAAVEVTRIVVRCVTLVALGYDQVRCAVR